jgi:hypothetical protein
MFEPYGGRKLALSAQMYHFELTKQRIVDEEEGKKKAAVHANDEFSTDESGDSYVVYECRGLASTDELEVTNPLFDEDLMSALTDVERDQKTEIVVERKENDKPAVGDVQPTKLAEADVSVQRED